MAKIDMERNRSAFAPDKVKRETKLKLPACPAQARGTADAGPERKSLSNNNRLERPVISYGTAPGDCGMLVHTIVSFPEGVWR